MDGESLCGRQIAGAPGRTRTRGPRFRKPMTHHSDSPTEWENPRARLTSSFFVFPPIYVNLPQFVPTIVTNWSQDLTVLCGRKHLTRRVWFECCLAPLTERASQLLPRQRHQRYRPRIFVNCALIPPFTNPSTPKHS